MADAQRCGWCGAPITATVQGACPHCGAIVDQQQAAGLVVDARGEIWRVVLVDAGRKQKKVAKALAGATGRDRDQARALVDAVQPGFPQIVADHLTGTAAMELVQALATAGATVRSEFRQGDRWAGGVTLGGWG